MGTAEEGMAQTGTDASQAGLRLNSVAGNQSRGGERGRAAGLGASSALPAASPACSILNRWLPAAMRPAPPFHLLTTPTCDHPPR